MEHSSKKRRKKILAVLMTVFFVVALYFGYVGFNTFVLLGKLKSDENVKSLDTVTEDEKINILIAGNDAGKFVGNKVRNERGRTDTLMVASIDPNTKQVNLLSIPRDSRVEIPGRGLDKINHAHAFGGMDLTVRTVQGFLDIPIHHYVKVNFEAFIGIVDAIGGVTLEIKESDLRGVINNDQINKLRPGVQRLTPEEAFQYVRIRNSDIGRVERQQKFVKAVMKETLKVSNVLKINSIIGAVAEDLDTDMSLSEMMGLANIVKGFKSSSLNTEMVPGKGGYINKVSYWIVDDEKKDELVRRMFK